jgi:hypothetical protein
MWYFIGARVSPTAHMCAVIVTHGTVTEDKEEVAQETSGATRPSSTKKRKFKL